MSLLPVRPKVVADVECYRDYFLICFHDIQNGRKKHFELFKNRPIDRAGIVKILRKFTVITFNGNHYDIPMIRLCLRQGVTNALLKKMNDRIIVGGIKPWDAESEFSLPEIPFLDHIDLIEPMPSVQVGLKLYGARLHSKRLQDLPLDPNQNVLEDDGSLRETMISYCYNDTDVTIDCYRHIEKQIELRYSLSEQYGVDLRSKSDAQIAEAVIRVELERIKGDRLYRPEFPPDYSFKYEPPKWLRFKTKQLQDVFTTVVNATFKLKKKEAKVDDKDAVTVGGVKVKISGIEMPPEIKSLRISLGITKYKLGIGGLHSMESKVSYFSDDDYVIKDADVAAFYPQLILVCALYPEHLGPEFLEIYRSIRERRMSAKEKIKKLKKLLEMCSDALQEAKTRGDIFAQSVIDMTLKIVLNGTFGKLGSKWSFLFAPNLMIQVTITGQLALLMLIERLELAGIHVLSANTDGIVCKIPRELETTYHDIIKQWEKETGFEMEFAEYDALYSRDVNNYIAVKPDGSVKQKGAFAFVGSKGSPAEKNPTTYVCVDAVIAYLTKGTAIEETLEWCPDVRRFLTVRRVTGGAVFDGEYLGKTVRWYYAKGSKKCIQYSADGKKVAKSDGAKPMMEIGDLPSDIDYAWYKAEAISMLGDLGVL